MAGNQFGTLFKVTTFGESHGAALGVVIDGCPAGLKLSEKDVQKQLDRRRPGQSRLVSPRKETDQARILSGVFKGATTGTPIAIVVENKDTRSADYRAVEKIYRPSHADFTYEAKYGLRDHRGGGRASARETVARVAAGAVAGRLLEKKGKIQALAYVKEVHTIPADIDPQKVTHAMIEKNAVRCPDSKAAGAMEALIEKTRQEGDSLGGIIECVVRNLPAGLGSPVFNKLEARLAHAMLSLPASKGFEIGQGFNAAQMKGSQHNDPLRTQGKKILTQSNHAGGVVGGISNGMDLIFRVAFKPPSSISKEQSTVTKTGKKTKLSLRGRHDPCVLPRAVPLVEAMTALVLADEFLIQETAHL